MNFKVGDWVFCIKPYITSYTDSKTKSVYYGDVNQVEEIVDHANPQQIRFKNQAGLFSSRFILATKNVCRFYGRVL